MFSVVVNLALAGAVLLALVGGAVVAGGARRRLWRTLSTFGIALGAVGLAIAGKHFEVWSGHPQFPSGHMTFVTALTVGLAVHSRRWLPALAVLWLVTGVSLVGGHFHSTVEVLGGAALGLSVGGLCQALLQHHTAPAGGG